MANYAVNDWVSDVDDLPTVLASIETKLESIDSAKTIRLIGVMPVQGGFCQGYIVYDA